MERHVTSMAAGWEQRCLKIARVAGKSCIGIQALRAERRATRRRQKIDKGFVGSHGNNRKLFAPKSFEICCTQEELICEEPQVF